MPGGIEGTDHRPGTGAHDEIGHQTLGLENLDDADVGKATGRPPTQGQGHPWLAGDARHHGLLGLVGQVGAGGKPEGRNATQQQATPAVHARAMEMASPTAANRLPGSARPVPARSRAVP